MGVTEWIGIGTINYNSYHELRADVKPFNAALSAG
jgi:hypothetical protein